MGSIRKSVSAYIRHRLSVRSKFRLHSPFIYKFWAGILRDSTRYAAYDEIEKFRKQLLSDERTINRLDLGAGAEGTSGTFRIVKIKDLARNSAVSASEGKFLYRLVKDHQPSEILELGTSLGISTLYLAEAAPSAKIITMEGDEETAALARSGFERAGKKNITVITGNFDDKLQEVLGLMPKPDLVFFDGNHRGDSTLKYWKECLPHLHAGSVAVLDDIHWSAGMEEAWKHIIGQPEVKVSIDLFHLGVVYFREELSKEDFVLRF